jgi:hypothetical protein
VKYESEKRPNPGRLKGKWSLPYPPAEWKGQFMNGAKRTYRL